MKKAIIIGMLALIALAGALGVAMRSQRTAGQRADAKLQVVSSFYPLSFIASSIGGDLTDVFNITPAGAEPHDYELTPQDIIQIENSRLLILNGGGFEVWGENIKQNIDAKKTLIVHAGEGLAALRVGENGQNVADPHVWLSPLLAKKMADAIAAGFIRVDPANADRYTMNADTLKNGLDGLDAEFKAGLASCRQKSIVTSHDAFGYLAAAYGLTQVPISGLSPDAEPSAQQLASITAFVRRNNITHIFFESLVTPKLSKTIANEVGAQTLVLNPLEGLGDEELAAGKDYFSEMRSNLANLQTALQCRK